MFNYKKKENGKENFNGVRPKRQEQRDELHP